MGAEQIGMERGPIMVTAADIQQIPLLARLSPAEQKELAGEIHERHYPRGAVIFREGDPGLAVYFVRSGRVKVYRVTPDGHERILGVFGPGQPFGLVTALDGSPYPATAEAAADSVVWAVPSPGLQRWLRAHPALAGGIMQEVGDRLRRAQGRVHSLTGQSVHQRLAGYLLDLVRVQSPDTAGGAAPIRLTMTHQELGAYLGASRETITRALADFRRSGAIRAGAGDNLAVDPHLLQAWLDGDGP